MAYRISVDTGGTFTDVVLSDEAGRQTLGKALTTPARIFDGMREALIAAAGEINHTLDEVLANSELLIYGTTRATNAIVTRNCAKTAFVTTEGFPDTLVVKEGGKFNPHDFTQDFPAPYIPRRHTFEVEERIGAEGNVSIPFNETQARGILADVARQRFEAIAVCFLWSISNSAHEQKLGALIDELLPGVPYTLSHQLIPVVREYRRASATAIDASLKPLMQAHLLGLQEDLQAAGYSGEVLISTTAGGCSHVAALVEKPIYTVGSGPAMAPIAGLNFSRAEEQGDDVIICDTGGTTFDVGLVRDGRLTFSRDAWLGQAYTGFLLGISAVDVRSVGAGGGSIAWIDEGGLMRVGPQSAGADPGPACYGRGGTAPTVSDAAVVLGYFDPDFFLGGRMQLDVEAARAAIGTVAREIGLGIEETAWRVLSLASDLMMRAIGDITINEGFDPRESTIVAGGGAAGVNIMTIAKELGCQRVILPKVASALSAAGMQFADVVAEEATSLVMTSDRFDFDRVNATLDALKEKLNTFRQSMPAQGKGEYTIEFLAEARYMAQVWELDTPLPTSHISTQADLDGLVEAFHQIHERVFAVRDEGSAVEVVSWKARLSLKLGGVAELVVEVDDIAPATAKATRQCYFGSAKAVETPIHKSDDLSPGMRIEGPAIIEEPTTTLVVYPGMATTVSGAGNYLMHID